MSAPNVTPEPDWPATLSARHYADWLGYLALDLTGHGWAETGSPGQFVHQETRFRLQVSPAGRTVMVPRVAAYLRAPTDPRRPLHEHPHVTINVNPALGSAHARAHIERRALTPLRAQYARWVQVADQRARLDTGRAVLAHDLAAQLGVRADTDGEFYARAGNGSVRARVARATTPAQEPTVTFTLRHLNPTQARRVLAAITTEDTP